MYMYIFKHMYIQINNVASLGSRAFGLELWVSGVHTFVAFNVRCWWRKSNSTESNWSAQIG